MLVKTKDRSASHGKTFRVEVCTTPFISMLRALTEVVVRGRRCFGSECLHVNGSSIQFCQEIASTPPLSSPMSAPSEEMSSLMRFARLKVCWRFCHQRRRLIQCMGCHRNIWTSLWSTFCSPSPVIDRSALSRLFTQSASTKKHFCSSGPQQRRKLSTQVCAARALSVDRLGFPTSWGLFWHFLVWLGFVPFVSKLLR